MSREDECETGDIVHLVKVNLKTRPTKRAVIIDPTHKYFLYINSIKGRYPKDSPSKYEKYWKCLRISSCDYDCLNQNNVHYCISCREYQFYNWRGKNQINRKRVI